MPWRQVIRHHDSDYSMIKVYNHDSGTYITFTHYTYCIAATNQTKFTRDQEVDNPIVSLIMAGFSLHSDSTLCETHRPAHAIMMIAYVLVLNRHQFICKHHVDSLLCRYFSSCQ